MTTVALGAALHFYTQLSNVAVGVFVAKLSQLFIASVRATLQFIL